MKNKIKCRGCGSDKGVMKWYVIADDIETPRPYHPGCIIKFRIGVIRKLSDINAEINQ
jgi:hypothetical protein